MNKINKKGKQATTGMGSLMKKILTHGDYFLESRVRFSARLYLLRYL